MQISRTQSGSDRGSIIRGEEVDDAINSSLKYNKDMYGAKQKSKLASPVIHFPGPPGGRPRSSSSSTSDSSLYYNRNIVIGSDKKYQFTRGLQHSDKDDNLYAMIKNQSDKKRDHHSKKAHHRRKHGNRVGSIDGNAKHINSDSDIGTSSLQMHYDQSEEYMPSISQDRSHYDKAIDTHKKHYKKLPNGTIEAINSEILNSLHTRERLSGDSGSIGSFLSMASVKSFPRYKLKKCFVIIKYHYSNNFRCSVPEPLSRVLEPVSVTHLDHYDPDAESNKNKKYISSDPAQFQRSSSDGADPGVIGPIVWEIHKNETKAILDVTSPIRDPALMRNRFEGLLEGAINLYTNNSTQNERTHHHHTPDDNSDEPVTQRDFRGKSAPKIK